MCVGGLSSILATRKDISSRIFGFIQMLYGELKFMKALDVKTATNGERWGHRMMTMKGRKAENDKLVYDWNEICPKKDFIKAERCANPGVGRTKLTFLKIPDLYEEGKE